MIELKVFANRRWRYLDTYGNENISLTFQVDDVRNIANKNASYSKDFNLPATKRNNQFFEHYYDLDRYNLDFSAYKSFRAELYVDGILILEGYLKLLGTLEKQTEISYRIVIFNDVANLLDSLGDRTIAELDLPELNHNFTYQNVVASWFGIDMLTNIVPYSYSLIGNGNIYYDGDTTVNYIPHRSFVLNLKLKYILDKIFEFAGFSYTSAFFDSLEFNRLYFDTTSIKDYGEELEDYSIQCNSIQAPLSIVASNTITGSVGVPLGNGFFDTTVVPVENVNNDTLGEFDPDTSTFTAQNNCTLSVLADIQHNNGNIYPHTISMYINGEEVDSQDTNSASFNNLNPPQLVSGTTGLILIGSIALLQGQTAQITFSSDIDPQNLGGSNYTAGLTSGLFKLTLQVTNASNQELVKTTLGDIKLADVVKDIFTMFNLIATDNGNKNLSIEPYVDYISNKIVDYTPKVDINEIELEPIEIPRSITFRHAQEKDDYYHSYYLEDNNIEYGTHRLIFDVDSQEDEVIELKVFAAPFIKTLNNTDIDIQHIGKLDDDSIQPYKNKPRIVYRVINADPPPIVNPPTTAYNLTPIEVYQEWQDVNILNQYPQMTQFNELVDDCQSSDNSYTFGLINPSAINGNFTQPVNTLFQRFWRKYIEEKYNVETRILKIKAKLTATDIMNLDFSKLYKIEDQYYRLNKVDYNTDKNKLSKLELIRI